MSTVGERRGLRTSAAVCTRSSRDASRSSSVIPSKRSNSRDPISRSSSVRPRGGCLLERAAQFTCALHHVRAKRRVDLLLCWSTRRSSLRWLARARRRGRTPRCGKVVARAVEHGYQEVRELGESEQALAHGASTGDAERLPAYRAAARAIAAEQRSSLLTSRSVTRSLRSIPSSASASLTSGVNASSEAHSAALMLSSRESETATRFTVDGEHLRFAGGSFGMRISAVTTRPVAMVRGRARAPRRGRPPGRRRPRVSAVRVDAEAAGGASSPPRAPFSFRGDP